MVAIPTIEEEDAKRPNRQRETLIRETTRNRMKACLVRFGVRGFDPTLRKAADRLEKLITPEGVRRPPLTLAEMLRDMARLRFLREQIRSIEKARVLRLKDDPTTRTNAMVHLIARIFGIAIETADTLVHEVLSRNLRDRRAVTRYAGLTGSPDEPLILLSQKTLSQNAAGDLQRESGMGWDSFISGGWDGSPIDRRQ